MCNVCTRDVAPVVEKPPAANRTLERMKRKHNIITDPNDEGKQKEVAYQPDLLAVSNKILMRYGFSFRVFRSN
ncbi:unnamed protein product, partial [Iphiclides podalirius]